MEIKIYYQDTDCGGVVYYANYLTYFERARTEFLQERGLSVRDLAKEGVLFVVTHAEVDFKSPAYYGDILEVFTRLERVTNIRLEFTYRIQEKESQRLVVTGRTTLACVNNSLKPQSIPEGMKDIISKEPHF